MMDRRIFLTTVAGLLAAPFTTDAQQAGKIARVGFLVFGPAWSPEQLAQWKAQLARNQFWQPMRELGWVYGQNVVAERRFGESADQLHASAAELVRLKVDVVVVRGCGLATIVQGATRTIPIVVTNCGYDMVTAGLAASLARPGGNITGTNILSVDLVGKRLQLLKELLPNLSRVALLGERVSVMELNPTVRDSYRVAAEVAATTLGMRSDFFVVERPEDFPAVFRSMNEKGDRGLLQLDASFTDANYKEIIALAATHRIAVLYSSKFWVEAGGLMSYGSISSDLFRHAAVYVDKILRGAKPGDLPIAQATQFELVINLKTAKALGLTIPPSVLGRADEVIR